jgi:nucleoid DNA-binding protein
MDVALTPRARWLFSCDWRSIWRNSTYFMAHLTKRDLVVRISNETGMVQRSVQDVIDLTMHSLIESLGRGQTVEFRNFGVFEVKIRKARVGRNPKRPETDVQIPARAVVRFKAGKQLKAEITKRRERDEE